MQAFVERLKELRKKNNLTQKELCDKLNFGYVQYNHWETGRNEPDLTSLLSLANFYSVSVDYLLGNSDNDKETMFQKEFSKLKPELQMIVVTLLSKLNHQEED